MGTAEENGRGRPEKEKEAAPSESRMEAAVLESVVGDAQEHADFEEAEQGRNRGVLDEAEGEAREAGADEATHGEDHKALVNAGAAAIENGGEDERGEEEEIREGERKEGDGAGVPRSVTAGSVDRDKQTDPVDQESKHNTENAQAAMKGDAMRGDEANLDQEKQEPSGEDEAVKLKEERKRLRVEERLEVVGAGEAYEGDKHDTESDPGVVVAGRAGDGRGSNGPGDGWGDGRDDGTHASSLSDAAAGAIGRSRQTEEWRPQAQTANSRSANCESPRWMR